MLKPRKESELTKSAYIKLLHAWEGEITHPKINPRCGLVINADWKLADLQNSRTSDLQTWYRDGVRWPASLTYMVTSKLKALVQVTTCRGGAYCGGPATDHTTCFTAELTAPVSVLKLTYRFLIKDKFFYMLL